MTLELTGSEWDKLGMEYGASGFNPWGSGPAVVQPSAAFQCCSLQKAREMKALWSRRWPGYVLRVGQGACHIRVMHLSRRRNYQRRWSLCGLHYAARG